MRSRKWKAEDGRQTTEKERLKVKERRQRAAEKKRLSEEENFSFYMSNFVDRIIERVDSFGQQFSE